MVFGYRLRGLLSPLLNGGDVGYFSDAVSRDATEVCEEFYDTLKV
jgi:lysozyme family protein